RGAHPEQPSEPTLQSPLGHRGDHTGPCGPRPARRGTGRAVALRLGEGPRSDPAGGAGGGAGGAAGWVWRAPDRRPRRGAEGGFMGGREGAWGWQGGAPAAVRREPRHRRRRRGGVSARVPETRGG